jgi:ubiquinol-cytochrome c reductase cytochrome c1 subunit
MNKTLKTIVLGLSMTITGAYAAGGGVELREATIDSTDMESLQNGARLYVNYCQGCHSMKYQRYNRIARDLQLTEDEVQADLMFTSTKIHDTMGRAMPAADAEKWFGVNPPDLSLTARSRGTDWLFSYLTSFYVDPAKPTGVNNLVFPDVGMPFVLAGLQGEQVLVTEGEGEEAHQKLSLAKPGSMSVEEYEKTVNDLVNFMAYVSDPVKNDRETLGIYVIGLLLILFVLSYFLKKVYWRGIKH